MAAGIKDLSRTFVWVIVALLIVGLAGFGAVNFTGTVRTVATVGNQTVSVDEYARELRQQMRAMQAQSSETITMQQVREMGIDRMAVARLVQLAALDSEAADLGLSMGDVNLQKEITSIPAFQGIDGKFDRQTYKFQLEQANIKESDFENDLRAESARTLVQGAIVAGVKMPPAMADMLANFVGARRNFSWAALDASALETPVAEPTEEQLQAWYDEHPDDFVLPETKKITYAILTPEMMLDQVEISEEDVRRLFEERRADYELPERRLVERLVYSSEDAAKSAMAQLEVGGTTFEALVEDRGLRMADTDMGDVTRDDLDAAAEDVFAAEEGAVVGPLPSDLGPALYRINGKLEERVTAFEDAEQELRDELAGERVRRLIETREQALEDTLAGGATLEELTQETEMELGTIEWSEGSDEGVAAYADFDQAAANVEPGDFPEIAFLEDGGIFALRLDEVLPPRPEPFEQAREAVAEAWVADQIRKALTARAEAIIAELGAEGDFVEAGLPVKVENGLTRTAYIEGTPEVFMTEVFRMEKGALKVVPNGDGVIIVRVEDVLPPADTPEFAQLRATIQDSASQALAQALFSAYVRDAQLRARPSVDEQALNAVNANFN